LGLGFVIFVHELGHFVVAKLCGVKCEKFYLGFDIGGLKFCKFRWGETEYGIGILPFGGYVKMLGQEDNPARLKEELERSKQSSIVATDTAAAQDALYNPRSFLAKSIPKRMAIISAGVIMNVIFAFLMAVVAFWVGVEQTPCIVGVIFPGAPAWQADLRVGDEVLEIAGRKMSQFRDLQTAISLGNIDSEKGVPMLVHRPGIKEPLTITVKPDHSYGAPMIGVSNGKTTQLMTNRITWLVQKRYPVLPGSIAAKAEPEFCNGDTIVKIDETPIVDYAQLESVLARKADKKIAVIVERRGVEADGKRSKTLERVTISVAPNPMRTLGLVMKIGEVTAVQAGSPAAVAGILPGDVIRKIDGRDIADPMMLPYQLRGEGKIVELTIQREASKTPIVVSLRLRNPQQICPPEMVNSPLEIPSLGIAYRVLNRVDRVVEDSPAAKAGLLPEDSVVRITLLPPSKESLGTLQIDQPEATIPFSEKERNWPSFFNALQNVLPGTTVQLTVLRQDKEKTVKLTPVEAAEWFNPDRGFIFEPLMIAHKPKTLGEAMKLGGQETLDSLTLVFHTLRALGKNQVSPRNLGGPVMIVRMAVQHADEGMARLLLFLTMLSANLAILNFLPIPVLDGGLMMFMIYEGIRGKPANEHVQMVLTYIGLVFIILLMVWCLGLDLGAISRR
jgi:regulator of sigma E protease